MAMPPSSVASRRGESAAELADGGAGGAEDHGLGHMDHGMGMRACATTDARRPDVAPTPSRIGVFETRIAARPIAHDVPGGELAALLDAGEARAFKHLAVWRHDGRQA